MRHLGRYYKDQDRDDYYNEEGEGKFAIWCDDNGYDNDMISDGFEEDSEEPPFYDFDDDFPKDSSEYSYSIADIFSNIIRNYNGEWKIIKTCGNQDTTMFEKKLKKNNLHFSRKNNSELKIVQTNSEQDPTKGNEMVEVNNNEFYYFRGIHYYKRESGSLSSEDQSDEKTKEKNPEMTPLFKLDNVKLWRNFEYKRTPDDINTYLKYYKVSDKFCLYKSVEDAKDILILGPDICNLSKVCRLIPEFKDKNISTFQGLLELNLIKTINRKDFDHPENSSIVKNISCYGNYIDPKTEFMTDTKTILNHFSNFDNVHFGRFAALDDTEEVKPKDLIADFQTYRLIKSKANYSIKIYFSNIKRLLKPKGYCYIINSNNVDKKILKEYFPITDYVYEVKTVQDIDESSENYLTESPEEGIIAIYRIK